MNRYNQTQKIMEHLILKNKNVFSNDQKGRLMVVFTGTKSDWQEILKQLENLKSQGYTFDFTISSNGEKLLNINEIKRRLQPRKIIKESSLTIEEGFMEEIEGVLVPFLTQNTAIKLSLGIQDQLVPRLLWEALWEGIPIWMNLDGPLKYKGISSCNSYVMEKIKTAVGELEKMGIKPLDTFKGIENISKSTSYPSNLNHKKRSIGRRVITERDVLTFEAVNGEMIVSSDVIITPLAKDAAKTRGVKIIKGQ